MTHSIQKGTLDLISLLARKLAIQNVTTCGLRTINYDIPALPL